MATSKVNIFNSLPQHLSDSEGEDNSRVQTKRGEKKEQRDNKKAQNKTANAPVKEDHSRQHEAPKQKGLTDKPHPQGDRHSGTGNQAYGGKPKKGGAGKGNWGNNRDDRRVNDEPREAGAEGTTEEAPQVPVVEEPEGITLQEYYSQHRAAQNEPQINEAKAKITSEQLKKELGTATLLKTRQQQEIDDRKAGKKKTNVAVDHFAAINTEHANLLNFRTGFVEKEYRSRNPEDAADGKRNGPRTGAPRGDRQNRERGEDAKQEEPKTQPDTQPTDEVKPTTEGATEAAATTPAEGQETQERRREGGNRGHRGGRGGQRGGRPYGGRKPQEAKINFEDESAFPKLG